MNWLYLSDCFGVVVFAISGALAAGRRSMDIFGVLVIGFVTALGGGTLRDLLLGIHPIGWIGNPVYLLLVSGAVIATVLGGRITHRFDERLFIVSDAFGLAVFTVIGVLTGAGGGAIRDIICNDIPSILKREIYATASASGGLVYCLLNFLGADSLANTLISILCVLMIRLVAVKSHWALPSFRVTQ